MKKTLIGAAAVALGLTGALAFAGPASAAVVNSNSVADWQSTAGGKAELLNVDGVKLTTKENADKITWRKDIVTKLVNVTTLQYETERLGGTNDMALPAYHLYIDTDNDSDVDTTLIFEPYWQGPGGSVKQPAATTTTWDVDAGYFWSSKSVTDKLVAGVGGPPFYTLTDVNGFYPDARVLGYGIGQGSYNADAVTRVNHVKFQGTTNNWAPEVVVAVAPTYTASPDCNTFGVVKPATTPVGVEYTTKRNVVDGITVSATVTATAKTGYVLKDAVDGKIVFGPYDVTKKTEGCVTTPPVNESPSATPTPTKSTTAAPIPSDTESTESQNAGLPVTGPGGGTNVPLVGALAGTALLALGAALFVWARRRNTVAFTA